LNGHHSSRPSRAEEVNDLRQFFFSAEELGFIGYRFVYDVWIGGVLSVVHTCSLN
jgi:hypothetical protein